MYWFRTPLGPCDPKWPLSTSTMQMTSAAVWLNFLSIEYQIFGEIRQEYEFVGMCRIFQQCHTIQNTNGSITGSKD